jgi:hypothetical protein
MKAVIRCGSVVFAAQEVVDQDILVAHQPGRQHPRQQDLLQPQLDGFGAERQVAERRKRVATAQNQRRKNWEKPIVCIGV